MKESREEVPASIDESSGGQGPEGKDHVSLVTDAVWSVSKCSRHKKIILMTRQEVCFLI